MRATCWCALAFMIPSHAATLQERARDSGCINKPAVVEGETYRCMTKSGAAYFNVPGVPGTPERGGQPERHPFGLSQGRRRYAEGSRRPAPQSADRRARDRREAAREARSAYGNGAPPATPEEQAAPQKYADRVAKLRQAVSLHEKNIEALKNELAATH